jgi:putative membrane protein
MTNQTPRESAEVLPTNLRLAYERTRGAYERTMMAWVRTGTSLITFGFAVYKFFQFEISGSAQHEPLIKTSLIGPREFGILLIGIGVLSLVLGTIEHARDLRAMRKEYPGMPGSNTRYIAALVLVLGLMALVAVVYRF